MRFAGKVAVVTGGASGIGAATAAALAREGAAVTILDVAAPSPCDVTDARAVERALALLPRIDVLVNAAGIPARRPIDEEEEDAWGRCLDVNLKGIFLASKYALAKMTEGGAIVSLSSVTGITGTRGRAAYSASKGAIVALTRNMALDYAPRGIRVNCVCPGFVRTPLLDALLRDPGRTARLTAMHPLGRLGEPEEIATAILFLASADAAWITGHALVIDGGFSAGHATVI